MPLEFSRCPRQKDTRFPKATEGGSEKGPWQRYKSLFCPLRTGTSPVESRRLQAESLEDRLLLSATADETISSLLIGQAELSAVEKPSETAEAISLEGVASLQNDVAGTITVYAEGDDLAYDESNYSLDVYFKTSAAVSGNLSGITLKVYFNSDCFAMVPKDEFDSDKIVLDSGITANEVPDISLSNLFTNSIVSLGANGHDVRLCQSGTTGSQWYLQAVWFNTGTSMNWPSQNTSVTPLNLFSINFTVDCPFAMTSPVTFSVERDTNWNIVETPFTINITGNTSLQAPSGLTVTSPSFSEIAASWSSVDGAIGYILQYSTRSTFPEGSQTKTISQTEIAGKTSYLATNLLAETTYYFRVMAVATESGVGNSDYCRAESVATLSDAPTNIIFTAVGVDAWAPTGTTVGTLSSEDPDPDETFVYSVSPTQNPHSYFSVNGNRLILATSLTQPGTYTVGIVSTNSKNKSITKTFEVVVSTIPIAQILDNSVTVQSGIPFLLSGEDSADGDGSGITGWFWDIDGDGQTDLVGKEVWINPNQLGVSNVEGFYEVKLTVQNGSGKTSRSVSAFVEVLSVPTSVYGKTTSFGDGRFVKAAFDYYSTAGDVVEEWTINWGDGNTETIDSLSRALSAVHRYTSTETSFALSVTTLDTAGDVKTVNIGLITVPDDAEPAAIPNAADTVLAENGVELASDTEIATFALASLPQESAAESTLERAVLLYLADDSDPLRDLFPSTEKEGEDEATGDGLAATKQVLLPAVPISETKTTAQETTIFDGMTEKKAETEDETAETDVFVPIL